MSDHGTRARFQSRTDPCHCNLCRQANTDYQRVWRQQQTAELRRLAEIGRAVEALIKQPNRGVSK